MTTISLDGEGNLQQQICRGLRQAITTGRIRPDSRLAPSRIFAEAHGVSRNTVIAAYDQLIAEGYLETRRGAGTFVVQLDSIHGSSPKTESVVTPSWSTLVTRLDRDVPLELLLRQPRRSLQYDFLYGEPGYAELPLDRWARTIGRAARELTEAQLGYNPVAGLPELRQALVEYLGRSRGVVCDADQVFIVQGTQDAIDLAVRAFVNEGDIAVLEEPRYRGFARCLLAAGANIRSVGVDDQGLQTDELKQDGAKIAFVTPSHQFPYGSVMSLARRQQLLAWARKEGTVIFEDDYDGEFRYEGRPIPSLQSLDDSGLVIYAGTASKMLFPALRLAWMVVPKQMVAAMQKLRSLSDSSGTILEQMAFSRFIRDGFLERHIHKMRRAQEQRRKVLLQTLDHELGNLVQVTGTEAGIHVLVKLLRVDAERTQRVVAQAAAKGVGVYPATLYYAEPPHQAELLIGYASLTPEQIRIGIQRLADVITKLSR